MVHMSSTKIHKLLNTHPEARKCLIKLLQERILKETEDGNSLAVYTRVVN